MSDSGGIGNSVMIIPEGTPGTAVTEGIGNTEMSVPERVGRVSHSSGSLVPVMNENVDSPIEIEKSPEVGWGMLGISGVGKSVLVSSVNDD